MKNTVEYKKERTQLKNDRRKYGEIVKERDLTPEEQDAFDAINAKIDSLDSRIAVLEALQDQDDAEDDGDQAQDDADDASEEVSESKQRSKPKHLDFKISTSKTKKDSGVYSIQRALQCAVTGHWSGLEAEQSQEIARSKGPAKGFYMPTDFKVSQKHRTIKRDLTTTTGAGGVGILTQPTYIELLRSKLVLEKLGVQIKTDLKGKVNYPRQNAATQFTWIGEGVSATPSNPTFDAVSFAPKTASTLVNISRKEIFESSFDSQASVESDMSEVMSRGIDTSGLNGNPAVNAASPLGILQNPNVMNYTLAADSGNGGKMSYNDVLAIESIVAESNADQGNLAWCMRPALRGVLKATPKVNGATAYPEFVYASDNTVNGYPVAITTEMPNNLTKGTTTTCQAAIFGNWGDACLALWSGVDVIVNPYIYASSGAVQIVMLQEVDFQIFHNQSFVSVTDATLS